MKILPLYMAIAALALTTVFLMADDDYGKKQKKRYWNKESYTMASKSPQHQLYLNECAACHMAFQPEFLPKRSWKKMMEPKELENHFGMDASLEEEDRLLLAAYLGKNAADAKPVPKKYAKIAYSIPRGSTPLRISEAPYFKKEHREIPKRLITQKEVKSIANCMACHTKADQGDYSERNIMIPNYGRWDD